DTGVDIRPGASNLLFADSVVEARDGGSAIKVKNGAATANAGILAVTAIGRAGAAGILSFINDGDLYIENVIAHGTDTDLAVRGTGPPVVAGYSNSRAAASDWTDNGYTQPAATPCFRDWAGGDYRPIQTSPVVGAGYLDGRSPTDGWGVSRSPNAEIGAL